MTNKKGVIMYYDLIEQLEDFNDKDFREIITAMVEYDKNGVEPQFDGMKKVAFKFIKSFIDKNQEEYARKCEKNRENIMKRWQQEDTNEYERIRTNTNDTDKDIDKDKDIEIDKDKDIEIEIKKENTKEKEIFDYWNANNLHHHRELSNEMRRAINKTLKKYTLEEIKTAIQRYGIIYNAKNYFWHYEWTLTNFLTRAKGLPEFLDDGEKWLNYLNQTAKKQDPFAEVYTQIKQEEQGDDFLWK